MSKLREEHQALKRDFSLLLFSVHKHLTFYRISLRLCFDQGLRNLKGIQILDADVLVILVEAILHGNPERPTVCRALIVFLPKEGDLLFFKDSQPICTKL